jgi:hypothetical protein
VSPFCLLEKENAITVEAQNVPLLLNKVHVFKKIV